mgnify:CR=1 FL=1
MTQQRWFQPFIKPLFFVVLMSVIWLGIPTVQGTRNAIASSLASHLPIASIHTYQERPGQTTFRSKQSLRDRTDRSWQVILFKRYQGETIEGLYLRLVGFPGIVTLNADKPLKIATGSSLQWQATPALDPQTGSLPDNSNQYDVAQVLTELTGDIPLEIDIPLASGSVAKLVVPPFAVHEWRALNQHSPANT